MQDAARPLSSRPPAGCYASPAEQAEFTLAMCQRMGYSFKRARREMLAALEDQRSDPAWRAGREAAMRTGESDA